MNGFKKGDKDQVIKDNIGLVHYVIDKFFRWTGVMESGTSNMIIMEYDDLVSEGVIGLMSAVDRFDKDRGNKFSVYAVHRIRSAIQKAIAKKGGRTLRHPKDVLYLKLSIDKEHGDSYSELYSNGDITEKEFQTIQRFINSFNPFDPLDVESDCLIKKDFDIIENDSADYILGIIRKIINKIYDEDTKNRLLAFRVVTMRFGMHYKMSLEYNYKDIVVYVRKNFKDHKLFTINDAKKIVRRFIKYFRRDYFEEISKRNRGG